MANDELGTVISTMEGPTTLEFSFVIGSPRVRKGQFVKVKGESGFVLGSVSEITRANRYFERAESVAEYERSSPMTDSFPTADWEYVVANVRVHGVFEGESISRSTFPVAPGSRVLEAEETLLKKFLSLDDNGLNIGNLQHHTLSARLSMGKLFQKHLAILAMSGSGKSYLMSVLIEEMLERKPENGRMSIVVLDSHGEYTGFRQTQYGKDTEIVSAKKFRIAFSRVTPQMLREWSPEMSSAQVRELAPIMESLRREKKDKHEPYSLEDLIGRVESEMADKKRDNVKRPLIAWLAELSSLRLFSAADFPKLQDAVAPGRLTVIDLSEIENQRKKQILVSYLCRRLFKMRKKEKIPPFLLVVEEAHNYAPEKVERSRALAKSPIITIAREGRKFGACLCLISQRPVQLATTALSQCVTPDTLVTRYDGYLAPISDMAHSWAQSEVMTYDAERQSRMERTPSAYLAKNPKLDGSTVFELSTSGGRRIRATDNHPFWVEGKGWVSAYAIETSDRVAVRPLQEFDFELNGEERMLLSEDDIRPPAPVRRHEIIHKLRSLGLLPLTTSSLKLPILARLMGHIYGDGTLHPPYLASNGQWLHRITFTGKEEELEQIKKDLARLGFPNDQKIQHQFRASTTNFIEFGPHSIKGVSTCFKVGFCALWFLLKELGAPLGDKSNQPALIPKWLMSSPRHIKREFIAAYLGSECSSIRFKKRWAEALNIPFCKSQPLGQAGILFASQIQMLLKDFEIGTSCFSRPYCRRSDGSSSTQFVIQIKAERSNIIRFSRRVGYRYSPSKEANSLRGLAFLEYIDSMTAKKQEVLAAVQSMDGSITASHSAQIGVQTETARSWRSRNITKARLCPTDHLPSFEKWLAQNCGGLGDGLIWEKISSKILTLADDVRDLTIPDTHCFFANGFLTHNCNTNIILRITNPFDIKHVGESCEGIDSSMLDSITTLRVGEALIVGEAAGSPIFVKVRKKKTSFAAKGRDLELIARKFEEEKKKKKQDVEAFL